MRAGIISPGEQLEPTVGRSGASPSALVHVRETVQADSKRNGVASAKLDEPTVDERTVCLRRQENDPCRQPAGLGRRLLAWQRAYGASLLFLRQSRQLPVPDTPILCNELGVEDADEIGKHEVWACDAGFPKIVAAFGIDPGVIIEDFSRAK